MYGVCLTIMSTSGVFRSGFDCKEHVRMEPEFSSCNPSPTNFPVIVKLCDNMKIGFCMGHVLKTHVGMEV